MEYMWGLGTPFDDLCLFFLFMFLLIGYTGRSKRKLNGKYMNSSLFFLPYKNRQYSKSIPSTINGYDTGAILWLRWFCSFTRVTRFSLTMLLVGNICDGRCLPWVDRAWILFLCVSWCSALCSMLMVGTKEGMDISSLVISMPFMWDRVFASYSRFVKPKEKETRRTLLFVCVCDLIGE